MALLMDPSGWFTLELPQGWESSSEDCVTIVRGPLRVGTMFVSGGRHSGGRQASFGGADFLGRFLRSLGLDVDDEAIEGFSSVGCRVYRYRRDTAEGHWTYWSVTDDETALILSYTCDAGDVGRETPQVDEIVRSVRFHPSGSVH
jgi:hypothetical protein